MIDGFKEPSIKNKSLKIYLLGAITAPLIILK